VGVKGTWLKEEMTLTIDIEIKGVSTGGHDVLELGLGRSEEVEISVVLGLHSSLEVLDSGYVVLFSI
jgi:hypothetical protein